MAGSQAPPRALINIEEIVRREQAEMRRRPRASRLADAVARVAGTPHFVAAHLFAVAAWAVVNLGLIPDIPPFDSFPFGLLGALFSLEGLLIAAFVLMKQLHADARAEERAHLDLQVSLLAEQEVTKVIQMLERISAQLGIAAEVVDAEARELGGVTAVGGLADALHAKLRDGDADGER